MFDEQSTNSIGSIAIAPSDPNVIYAGSGEANIRGNVAWGTGIFKSDDAGKTWQHVWKTRGQIGTMTVDPRNPDVAFAAVLGSPFGPNKERGVYRTTDGGKTWKQVLYKDDETGRLRRRARPEQSAHRVCRPLADPAQALGNDQRWPGQRPLPLRRRRRHLGATEEERPAGRPRGARSACVSRRRTRTSSTR